MVCMYAIITPPTEATQAGNEQPKPILGEWPEYGCITLNVHQMLKNIHALTTIYNMDALQASGKIITHFMV